MATPTFQGSASVLAAVSGLCLLGIGLIAGWLVALVLVVVTALVWLGYQLAIDKLNSDQAQAAAQRRALDAEWRALKQTRSVRAAFLEAYYRKIVKSLARPNKHSDVCAHPSV